MELNKIYNEPCLETLSKMPDKFLDSVITSPPYWQLRDYGYPEQWGLEPTYQEYLEHLWQMMDLIWLKLKDEGTVWINLGDTYNTKSGNMVQKDYSETINVCMDNAVIDKDTYTKAKDVPNKCLLLLPHRFAIGCIDKGWILRNDIIWAKRNGMPESVTDRFSKKHEFFFLFAKQQKYYFDLDSIRDKNKQVSIERLQRGVSENNKWVNGADGQTPHNLSQPRPNITTKIPKEQSEMFGSPRARQHRNIDGNMTKDGLTRTTAGLSLKSTEEKQNENGKNPGDVSDFWDIPTKPSSAKHYASYNDALLRKPVLAGSPENGVIYDPFMGTGSTAEVALRAKRQFIGSEMSVEYCDIAEKRLQPYLQQTSLF
jgi:DNA modification methylase